MTEKDTGSDWIQTWIEQQREQLRRAGVLGAQSNDKATDKADKAESTSNTSGADENTSDAARDIGMRWLEAGQSYLQGWQQFTQRVTGGPSADGEAPKVDDMFAAWMGASATVEGMTKQFADLMASMPSLGLARERTEAWRGLMAALADCQKLENELRAVWMRIQTEALVMVEKLIRERKDTQGIKNYRELYDLWVDCGEQIFAKIAHSEAYAKLQAEVGNAVIRLRAQQQKVIDRSLKHFDLPTRSELNTVHKQMREMRERITSLEAQLAEKDRGP